VSARTERLSIILLFSVALAIGIVGGALALIKSQPHVLNRAGALIVCVEGILILVEYARRLRLRHVEVALGADNPFVAHEVAKAERQIVIAGVIMIVAGEFLHGFGDMIMLAIFKMNGMH